MKDYFKHFSRYEGHNSEHEKSSQSFGEQTGHKKADNEQINA
jgi:hypothetical protein